MVGAPAPGGCDKFALSPRPGGASCARQMGSIGALMSASGLHSPWLAAPATASISAISGGRPAGWSGKHGSSRGEGRPLDRKVDGQRPPGPVRVGVVSSNA
jgi:hypothetical protein